MHQDQQNTMEQLRNEDLSNIAPNNSKSMPIAKRSAPSIMRHWVGIIIIIASTLASGILINLLLSIDVSDSSQIHLMKIKPPVYYASLSGVKVENEKQINRAITAIMIENSPAARPQSGLAAAEIVFEAIAEGGITRFLALYQTSQPSLIGPVRSVRPYYVSWLAPFQASVAHVGGSPRALAEIRNGKYRDIDQFFNGAYYWRSKDRYAPHNVYTNFEKLNQLNQKRGFTNSQIEALARQKPKAAKKIDVKKINLRISSPLYNSFYTYNSNENNYTRWQAGKIHQDREAGVIKTDAVIGMLVKEKKVMEDGYREDIEVIGSGKAYIFQNGTMLEATWKKSGQFNPLKFYDQAGKEVALNRGKLWISAVPESQGAVTWE